MTVTIIVFLALFVCVALLGLFGSRWRAGDLSQLHEWGLGGRSFGTLITWFLLGGDLYTAYTFIAVPALMFGAGAAGFFAVPYAALMYPLLFIAFPRLWCGGAASTAMSPPPISCAAASAIAAWRWPSRVTGIVATMPYIALQLVGMQVVIAALGLDYAVTLPLLGRCRLPLLAAFVVLAAFTYTSGLRGTALIAVVKDLLVYVTVLAAIIIIPAELGGYGKIFAAVPAKQLLLPPAPRPQPGRGLCLCHPGAGFAAGAVPVSAFGDGLAVVLQSRHVIRRNAMLLPAYSVALALIALLGYMAMAAGVKAHAGICRGLQKLRQQFRGAGAVPAHVPGLVRRRGLCRHRHRRAGAGLDHGDRLRQSFHPQHLQGIHRAGLHAADAKRASPSWWRFAGQAGRAVLRAGAADHLRHPAAAAGRHLDLPDRAGGAAGAVCAASIPRALLAGWAAGMAPGTWMAWSLGFKSSTYPLHIVRAGRFPAMRRSARWR